MRTPEGLQGKFYPTIRTLGCNNWEFSSVDSRCLNFSPNQQKCIVCNQDQTLTSGESEEDRDLKVIASALNVTPLHIQVCQYLEHKTGASILGNGRGKLVVN